MRGLRLRALLGLLSLGALGAGFAASGASSEEQIIANARRYTVQITVENRFALNDDEVGTLAGTGFLVDSERGWIITNAHVATRSPSTVTLRFKGGDALPARRIHVDPVLDLAILQIDPEKVPARASVADLDCTAMPSQGTRVLAYGNPGDMNHVATEGIVTGTRNSIATDLVMTDAEIANGSSGGPLIRISDGKVVGLISSSEIPDPDDADEVREDLPVNFAEPIPSVCRVLRLLRQGRDPDVHHLGFGIARGLDDVRPVVGALFADQPSLRMGDLIVSVNGKQPVGSAGELIDLLRGVGPNVRLTIRRPGEGLLSVVARTYPAIDPLEAKAVSFSGIVISEPWVIDDAMVNPNHYLRVHSIFSYAPFSVDTWDLVEAVDGRTFTSSTALYRYLANLEEGDQVRLMLRTQANTNQFYFRHKVADVQVEGLKLLEASGGAWDVLSDAGSPSGDNVR